MTNGANGQRFCKRCLLQDYDEEEYIRTLRDHILWMDEEMKCPEEMYRKRLDICLECDKLNRGTCLACGCYVELRAAAKRGKCPRKKW